MRPAAGRPRPGPGPAAGVDPPAAPSRPTWSSACASSTATTTTATPWRCSTRCSAAACRAGCSRRSARSGAWSTRCTPTGPPTWRRGALAIYAGTVPERAREVLDLIDAELDAPGHDGITDRELAVAKGHLKGSLALSLEDSAGRMSRIGRSQLVHGEVVPVRRAGGPHRGRHPRRRPPGDRPGPRQRAGPGRRRPLRADAPTVADAASPDAADRSTVPASSTGRRVGSTMTIKVGVFGAGGRMGSTVCRAVADDPDLELVAAVDPLHAGIDLRQVTGAAVGGLQMSPDADAILRGRRQVAVDFTHVDAARENLRLVRRERRPRRGRHHRLAARRPRPAGGACSPRATASSPPTSPSGRCS